MRILIVEDEEGIAAFLKQGLEEESFAVDVTYEGKIKINHINVRTNHSVQHPSQTDCTTIFNGYYWLWSVFPF